MRAPISGCVLNWERQTMKKFLFSIFVTSFVLNGIIYAAWLQWCCSHHKWVAYCSNWHVVCKDWWQGSSCTCGGSSYSTYTSTYTYTPTYSYTYTPTTTTSTYTPTYSYTYTPTTTTSTYDKNCQKQYWANSISSWTKYCTCKKWYVWSSDRTSCITESASCKEQFGSHSIASDPWYCKCENWYIRNDFNNKTKCISRKEYCSQFPNTEARDLSEYWACKCKEWYDWADLIDISSWCIPKDESCKKQYWDHVKAWDYWTCTCEDGYKWDDTYTKCIEDKETCNKYWPNAHTDNNGKCECDDTYEWNYNKNWCVAWKNNKLYWWKDFRSASDWWAYINMLLDFEDELERNKNNNKSQETSGNDTWLNKTPHKINEDEGLFRTEKNKVKMEIPDDDDDLSWSMINLMYEWAIEAKNRLWDKTKTLDGIVESLLEKDQETQEKFVKTVLELQNDKDQYTADIWEYLKFTLLYRKI